DGCKHGSGHPSATLFPLNRSFRQLAVYDPATKKLTHVGTCFSTHHLMFAEDASHTLWTSGGGPVVGWLNTKMFDETGDEMKSQGWTTLVVDTNGNGKRDAYVDRDGVMWAALASGHLASFDRRKCKGPLNGPTATGQHCPEGWTLYPEPLPQMKGVTDSGSAESSYYTWVDQFGTLGLGPN